MRRVFKLSTIAGTLLLAGVMTAMASATTEIDKADATFELKSHVTKVDCVGEDSATPYTQYSGTYKGPEVDLSPAVPTDLATGGLDHGLAGAVTWSKAKLTFNDLTGRGVAKGTFKLTSATAAIKILSGTLTLILQRDPAGTRSPVLGRGWLSASTFDTAGVKDGFVFANVEVLISTDLTTIEGLFGEIPWPFVTSGPIPPFSVETGLSYTC